MRGVKKAKSENIPRCRSGQKEEAQRQTKSRTEGQDERQNKRYIQAGRWRSRWVGGGAQAEKDKQTRAGVAKGRHRETQID
jgi:hypothetical protein